MKAQQTNLQRKRKALLVLPLVVIPFLTMAFWAMGGGKDEVEKKESKNVGLNLQLPNAQLSDDQDKTKLSFYEAEVKVDTNDTERAMDFPFGQTEPLSGLDTKGSAEDGSSYDPMPPGALSSKDPNEEKVYRKLAALNKELTRQSSPAKKERTLPPQQKQVSVDTEDVDRLAEMMQTVQSKSGPDAELEQLNGMMEKILDIQHPERVKARMGKKAASGAEKELPQMVPRERRATLSCLGGDDSTSSAHSPFLGLSRQARSEAANVIEAAVYQTQTIVNGSVITLRILQELTIGQTVVPAGTAVSGICRLNEERLEVDIPSVRVGRLLLPLKMEVYDMDGIRGIYVPGAITRDVAKNSVDNSVQMLEMSSLDPSIKGRAASAGIGAVRTLLSRKAKLVRVAVKAGYKVLLKEKTF